MIHESRLWNIEERAFNFELIDGDSMIACQIITPAVNGSIKGSFCFRLN